MSAQPARHLRLIEVDDETGEISHVESGALAKLETELVNLQKERDQLKLKFKDAEKDLAAKRRTIGELKRNKVEERLQHPDRKLIVRIADYWHRKCKSGDHRINPLSPARFDALAALVEMEVTRTIEVDGRRRRRKVRRYDMHHFKAAIDGCAFDHYVKQRKNGSDQHFDDLELICRDSKQFEEFIARCPYEPRPLEISGEKEDPSGRFQATAASGRHEFSEVSHEHHGFKLVGQGRGLVACPEAPWRGLVRRRLDVGPAPEPA